MGQLGLDRSVTSSWKPIKHPFFNNKNILKIAAGKLHVLVLCENNELYSWGVNDDCALGREGDEWTPIQVEISQRVVDICCGASYSALLTDRGQVFACGTFKSTSGVFGFDSTKQFQLKFTRIKTLRHIHGIYAGENHILFIDKDNGLWSIGANEQGQLGRVHRARLPRRCLEPFQVASRSRRDVNHSFVRAAGGGSHTIAINTSGECFAWGSNFNGQLGVGDTLYAEEKRPVALVGVRDVACGAFHTLFLRGDEVFACGDNTLSQVGIEGLKIVETPLSIVRGVNRIAAGCDFNIVEKGNRLYGWGSNMSGELGVDEIEQDEVKRPTVIDFDFGEIVSFVCGSDFVLVHSRG